MDKSSSLYRVHQCSKCTGGTEYYCVSCACNMCLHCKVHLNDLKTIYHDIVTKREKINSILTKQICERHPCENYSEYCKPCALPVCKHCTEHRAHHCLDIQRAYQINRQEHKEIIHTIRSEALFQRINLLTGIKVDIKTCLTEFSLFQSVMLTKAQRLKKLIDKGLHHINFKHRCLKQKTKMYRHLAVIQKYEHKCEQSLKSPVQFLLSIKLVRLHKIHLILHTSKLSMAESLNKQIVMESLSGIQITERGNRHVENDRLLKLMHFPEIHQSLTVSNVHHCNHISCVTPDRFWISDITPVLSNSTSDIIPLTDWCNPFYENYGIHTVNSKGELIFIDGNFNINKLSKDMKSITLFIEKTGSTLEPRCLYWSPSTGDLLVAMIELDTKCQGRVYVTRYNQTGQPTQTIQHGNKGRDQSNILDPRYITENNNEDVVVCYYHSNTVVVTERGGRHRFSFTGHPSGSELELQGICTDPLSHILVCDGNTSTVQLLDKNGHFLIYLLIRPSGIFCPRGLSYDVNTHLLWVGSCINNKVIVYRYINRHDARTDVIPTTTDVMKPLNEITETGKQKQGNECLLMMFPPKLLHSFTVAENHSGGPISLFLCGTSDRFWISGDENNLILTNTTGVPLHIVKDLCSACFRGLHTVNSEGELIYIDKNNGIKKLSKDMNTTITFKETTGITWEPHCVYWSPSTGDLLVGLYHKYYEESGVIIRYNQSGQPTQVIKHDNTGLELYTDPTYITENNNGDVVVSDNNYVYMSGAVVVTERGGRHRFTYTGHPPGSGLYPRGICTDALSHILVCNDSSVQMLDSDGQFLSLLLKKLQIPCCLSYDFFTNRLWVGSLFNKVAVYKYIDRPKVPTVVDKQTKQTDDSLSCSRPPTE